LVELDGTYAIFLVVDGEQETRWFQAASSKPTFMNRASLLQEL
jgi:hypothetical protein